MKFLISETKEVLPGATWTAAGISRHQFEVNKWCLELGGHCRTGLEDNIKYDKDRLAKSNAELVSKIVNIFDTPAPFALSNTFSRSWSNSLKSRWQ